MASHGCGPRVWTSSRTDCEAHRTVVSHRLRSGAVPQSLENRHGIVRAFSRYQQVIVIKRGNDVTGDTSLSQSSRHGCGESHPFESTVHVKSQPGRLELHRPTPPAGDLNATYNGRALILGDERFDTVSQAGKTLDVTEGETPLPARHSQRTQHFGQIGRASHPGIL